MVQQVHPEPTKFGGDRVNFGEQLQTLVNFGEEFG